MSIGAKTINATKNILSRTAYSAAISINENQTEIIPQCTENHQTTTCHRAYTEIPGPKELPFIGNSWRFAPFIGQYKIHELDKVMWSLYRDYGPIVKVGGLIGHPNLLFVFNGDDIQRVFRREEVLPHRPSMPSLHYYKQVLRKNFFGENAGVIGVHGQKWDDFRSQVQHIMLQPSTARKYVGPLNEIADDFMNRIHEMKDENNELPGDFLNELYKWALESVCRFSLDTRLGCLERDLSPTSEAQKIIKSINTFFWNVAEVELRMPIWRVYQNRTFKEYIGALDDFRMLCLKHIEKAMEKMASRDENFIEERREEDISVVERILKKTGNPKIAAVLALDLLLVGVDTTSVAVTSTIYQLTQNKQIQEKLFTELRTVLPNINTEITVKHLEKLPYLKACIKETLRMYPVILGNGRNLQSDAIISGYKVPKGTHVIFPHYVVGNLAEYFPEPQQFRPERWIKTTVNNNDGSTTEPSIGNNRKLCTHSDRIHPFVSLPFGYGRRTCIGRRFAEIEMQIVLAKIFRKYQVNYHYGKLTYKVSPTYIPKEPLKFRLTERKN